jgi:hypothetical protein
LPIGFYLNRYPYLTAEIVETILDPVVLPFATLLGITLGLLPIVMCWCLTRRFLSKEASENRAYASSIKKLSDIEVEVIESQNLSGFNEESKSTIEEIRGDIRKLIEVGRVEERQGICRRITGSLGKLQALARYYDLHELVDYYQERKTSFYKLGLSPKVLRNRKALRKCIKKIMGQV